MDAPQSNGPVSSERIIERLRDSLRDRGVRPALVPSRYIEIYAEANERHLDALRVRERAIGAVRRARLTVWAIQQRTERSRGQ
jgi:hypothetical protein